MNQDLGLRVLSEVMNWDNERARDEFAWIKLMARLKYDGYRDFQAGMRFIESLITWIQQFELAERETAYSFVRETLVYIGPSEIQKLVEQFYPMTVQNRLFRISASECKIPAHRILVNENAQKLVKRLRRKILFVSLSDGAHIDTIRRTSTGLLNNEQFVQGTQVDTEKWKDLRENLRDELEDPTARFRLVYLVDDFVATGTSFLRKEKGNWKGKLIRFKESIDSAINSLDGDKLFENNWELCVHHYVASSYAAAELKKRISDVIEEFSNHKKFSNYWARNTYPSFGMIFPNDLPIDRSTDNDKFIKLTQKYYDPILRTRHTDIGGEGHLGLGYGRCALPLVLEHNTPNNSIALLWAETDGGDRNGISAHPMRPLFRRRHRHL